MIILKDGVRYINHEYASEAELEKMVIEHYKEIFGKDALFFDKQMMKTKTGIKAKTDGFIISPDEKRWYILEIELSNHPLYEHIVPQITKFNQAYKSYEARRKITKAFNEDIKSSVEKEMVIQSKGIEEIHEFLTELVDSKPIIAIPIDVKTEELKEACETLPFKTRIVEFKTFVRENVGLEVHIHLFETLAKISPPSEGEFDTIVVPAKAAGFKKVFLGENRWWAIRIHPKNVNKLKYIAAYCVAPISAITHWAPIKFIRPWEKTKKVVVYFSEKPTKIGPIKLIRKGRVKAPQAPRYTTFDKLKNAKNLDEVF